MTCLGHHSRRATIHAFAAFGLLAVFGKPARAHAVVVEAIPKPRARVPGQGFPIRIVYNSRVDHRRSKLLILDGQGKEIPVPIEAEMEPNLISGQGPALPPGNYRLRWQVLAVDGHVTRGDVPFIVAG